MFGRLAILNAFFIYSIVNLQWLYLDVILSQIEKELYTEIYKLICKFHSAQALVKQ